MEPSSEQQNPLQKSGIKWHEVTWYSKLGALILFLGVVPALSFYIGIQYQLTRENISGPIGSTTGIQTSKNKQNLASATSTVVETNNGFSFTLPASWSVKINPINRSTTIVTSIADGAQKIDIYNQEGKGIGFIECRVMKTYESFETITLFSDSRTFTKGGEFYSLYYSEDATNTIDPADSRVQVFMDASPTHWVTADYSNQTSLYKPCQLYASEDVSKRLTQSDLKGLRNIFNSWKVVE